MREVVETGTDIAALAVGDPSQLDDLRACEGRGYEAIRDRAVTGGRLWRMDTDGDGGYLFHVFVEEDPPAELAPFLFDPIEVARLAVPSGRILIAGEECFVGALDPRKYPHMGGEIAVAPGDYRLTAFRSEPPADLLDERFAAAATPDERAAWAMGNRLPGYGVLFTLAALAAGFLGYLRWRSTTLAPLLPASIAIAWFVVSRYRRGARFQAAQQRFRALELELPSIVLVLRARAD